MGPQSEFTGPTFFFRKYNYPWYDRINADLYSPK